MKSRRQMTNGAVRLLVLGAVVLAGAFAAGCEAPGKVVEPRESDAAETEEDVRQNFVDIPLTTFPESPEGGQKSIFEEYRIASGDVLDVLYQARTWRKQDTFTLAVGNVVAVKFVHHANLNQEQSIRPDGTISLPYLEEVHVIGKTVQGLTDELREAYADILKDPEIYIVVPEFRNAIKELKKDLHTAPRGLSRLTTVRPDGYATFPMLGDMQVNGRTVPDVRKELDNKYEEILPGLNVDLFLREHAGRRIYVLGSVENPGAYEISRPTTVAEALALAGSYTPAANLDRVAVMRRQKDKMTGAFIDLEKALRLKERGRFFYLQPDDIVYVPRRALNRWATVMREISEVILFRGWSVGVSGSYELNDKGGGDD